MKRYKQLPIKTKDELEIDPYENFEGTKLELFLSKFFRATFKYKKIILLFLALIVFGITGYSLFSQYEQKQFEKATLEIEKVKDLKDESEILEKYNQLSKEYTQNNISLRLMKHQADAYAKLDKFKEAAELSEKLAQKISDVALKGYFFYVSGVFFESSKNLKKAEENYDLSISFIKQKDELKDFLSLAHYQSARLKVENQKKEDAISLLEEIINENSENSSPELEDIKKMSVYLLIKLKMNV